MEKRVHYIFLNTAILILIICYTHVGRAQQDPMFTQFQYNNDVFFNPASAGRGDVWRGSLMHRAQWVGLEGAPTTSVFVMEGPIQQERAGIGLTLFHDRIGANNHTGIYGSYAYRFPVSEGSYLSLGIRAGATHFGNDFSRIVTPDGAIGDPVYDQEGRVWVPRFGGGVFWNTERAYIGFAVPAFAAIVNQGGFIFEEDQAFLSRHYFISGGYVFDLGDTDIQLKPFAFIRYHRAAPVQMDVALQAWFKDWFSIGASYRWGDSVGAMLEIPIAEVFSLTYAYDYTTSAFRQYGQGAHEIAMSYRFVPQQKTIPSIHKFPALRRF
jgi:type IX secretion system PorP/SprF family membrane protein